MKAPVNRMMLLQERSNLICTCAVCFKPRKVPDGPCRYCGARVLAHFDRKLLPYMKNRLA